MTSPDGRRTHFFDDKDVDFASPKIPDDDIPIRDISALMVERRPSKTLESLDQASARGRMLDFLVTTAKVAGVVITFTLAAQWVIRRTRRHFTH